MTKHTYIRRIEIKNYRSCVDSVFEPNSGLSALIGPNGSGKTTILSAFQLLVSIVNQRYSPYRHRKSPEPFSSDCILKVTFDWNGFPIIYEAKISLVNNERNEDEVLSVDESWNTYRLTGSRKKVYIPLAITTDSFSFASRDFRNDITLHLVGRYGSEPIAKNVVQAIYDIARFIKSITYYSASIFTNPSNCPISFEVESESGARRGISITGHKKFLYDLYNSYKNESEHYKQFLELVGKEGVGLIDDLAFQEIETSSSTYKVTAGGHITTKEKKNNLIIPNFQISGNSLSPSQLSEGTFRTLALVFYLLTDRGSLMLIEEPEVCIHHGLLSSIIELIKIYSEEKQIIISTHSDQLLDQLDVGSVFKVDRSTDGTNVTNVKKQMSGEELKALKDYLRNEGGLGEYWKHGAL